MLGILSAIGASFSWTFACFLWRSQTKYFSPVQINLIKNAIAVILFSPALLSFSWRIHLNQICILFISGLIGIAIGDTLYINALTRLGTCKTLTIEDSLLS